MPDEAPLCFIDTNLWYYSFWDSLIVSSALSGGCKVLYSEDMQHKLVINQRLTILNPFL